jgi:CBS domain containing-hemolysin-like protein
VISILIIAILVLLNGFFVAAEFAIVGAPRATVRRLANEGSHGAARVLRILDDPIRQDRFIATAQLGITVASLGLGMVGEHAFAGWLAPRIGDWGLDRYIAAHTAATIVSVAVLSYFHIVLGEMVPKSLSLHHPQRMAMRITPLMRLIQLAMYPLIITLNALGNFVLRLMGIDRTSATHERYRTPDELAYEVRESQRSGLLPDESAEVMQELLAFTDLLARSVMIPRVYVTGIPVGADAQRVREILRASTHTRYPVYEGSLDCVVGVMHVKDILRTIAAGGTITAAMARPATFVAESECVEDVLGAMRRAHTQMTIVMDEHGGMAGIVTIEDLFEEVVGEIGEKSDQSPDVTRDGGGRLRVLGTTRIEQVGEALGMPLSHPRVDTVSGLVLTLLGRPASVGDCVEHAGVALEVTRTRGRGVAECIVSCAPAAHHGEATRTLGHPVAERKEADTSSSEQTLETLRDAVEVEAG